MPLEGDKKSRINTRPLHCLYLHTKPDFRRLTGLYYSQKVTGHLLVRCLKTPLTILLEEPFTYAIITKTLVH